MKNGLNFFLAMLITGICFSQNKNLKSADSLYNNSKMKEAFNIYQKLVIKDTSLPVLTWYRTGYAAHQVKNYNAALKYYTIALSKAPPIQLLPFLYINMSKVYAIKLNSEKAIEFLKLAASNGLTNPEDLTQPKEFTTLHNNPEYKSVLNQLLKKAYPCRYDEKYRQFDFWVGEWEVFSGSNRVGTSKIEKAAGDCAIIENWKAFGFPNEGKSINYVDAQSGKWEQVYIGSGNPAFNALKFFNGQYKDSVLVFEFISSNTNGEKLKGRFSFFNLGSNQVRQLSEVSNDGINWTIQYNYIYKRKINK